MSYLTSRVLMLAYGLLFAGILVAGESGHADQLRFSEGTHYFTNFDGKRLPERPLDEIEISDSDSVLSGIHYLGTFDKQGRLTCFQKIWDGHPVWLSRYGYGESIEPVWREFIDHEAGKWRRDEPWDGSTSLETNNSIDATIKTQCP